MAKQIKSFDEFKNELLVNTDLQDQFKQDPLNAIQQFNDKSPLESDPWIYRIVVLSLGLSILIIILGVVILMLYGPIKEDKNVPTIFTAIGSAAIGALAGLLAPSPRKSN